jgi:hypothetical protein
VLSYLVLLVTQGEHKAGEVFDGGLYHSKVDAYDIVGHEGSIIRLRFLLVVVDKVWPGGTSYCWRRETEARR